MENSLTEKMMPHLDTMARTVWGEARGEGLNGMLAVAWTIKNRADKPRWWGKNIKSVCLKKAQFSCWDKKDPNRKKLESVTLKDKEFRLAYLICDSVLGDESEDPTEGATHYHAKSIIPIWAGKLTKIKEIGNHIFYVEH